MIRRCRNEIIKIKNGEVGWVSGRTAIGDEFLKFFQSLFTTSSPNIPQDLENLIEPVLSVADNLLLTKIPDAEEIHQTLQKMALEKAPGPDGMTVFFFRFSGRWWDLMWCVLSKTFLLKMLCGRS